MKQLFLISILSLTFSQELKVEGNLNVTGAVINDSLVQVNATQQAEIDSLKIQINNQQSQITAEQTLIWDKEIPPSYYLENFAVSSEKSYIKVIRFWSYTYFISGILMLKYPVSPEMEIGGTFALLGGGIGIIMDALNDDPRTSAFKEFKKIESLQDKSKKEKLAYEALVSLALESRKMRYIKSKYSKKNSNRNPVDFLIAELIKQEISQILLTREEKILNNYLNQIPI